MQNELKVRVNPVIMGLIIFQILFIFLLIISLNGIFNSNEPHLEINVNDLSQKIEGLDSAGADRIEYGIYQAISDNLSGNNVDKNGIYIRDGSLIKKYFESANVNYVNFIVDIPDVGQSYQVAYEWSDDESNKNISPAVSVAVMCLDEEDLIYDTFDCRGGQDYMRGVFVSEIIRMGGYNFMESDGLELVLGIESYSGADDFEIIINYSSCDTRCFCREVSNDGKKIALEAFDKFVQDLGFKAKDIPHRFYNCEDEAGFINEKGAYSVREL